MNVLFESPRLLFKELNSKDALWFKELNDDPEVLQYTGDQPFATIQMAASFLSAYDEYEKHGFGRWSVWLKESNEPIGWCGLKYNEEEQIDLGFRFFKKYWNKGYATEAAIAAVQYGFEDLHIIHVVGRTSELNKGGQRVLEKSGFKFWKNDRAHGIENARYYRKSNPFLSEHQD